MGRRRKQVSDRADALAAAQATSERDRRALCLKRWPGILAAITTLVAAYNDGAGLQLLTIGELHEGDDPGVTIAAGGSAGGAITIAVEADALLVHTSGVPTGGLHGSIRTCVVDGSRSDLAVAAYLLQDWMDHL